MDYVFKWNGVSVIFIYNYVESIGKEGICGEEGFCYFWEYFVQFNSKGNFVSLNVERLFEYRDLYKSILEYFFCKVKY